MTYPQLRAALEARAVLEVGAVWLRLSRAPCRGSPQSAIERLHDMTAQIGEGGRFLDRDERAVANEAYHAAVVGLARERAPVAGFKQPPAARSASLRAQGHGQHAQSVFRPTRNRPTRLPPAATRRRRARHPVVGADRAHRSGRAWREADAGSELGVVRVVDPCRCWGAGAGERGGDVDALVSALDARAALEIGIMQDARRHRLANGPSAMCWWRVCAPSPRSCAATAQHVSRYIRASDAFHRIFFQPAPQPGAVRSTTRWICRNCCGACSKWRRSIGALRRPQSLTDALLTGDPVNAASAAMTEKANRIRAALASFLADVSKAPGAAARLKRQRRQRGQRRARFARICPVLDMVRKCVAYYAHRRALRTRA